MAIDSEGRASWVYRRQDEFWLIGAPRAPEEPDSGSSSSRNDMAVVLGAVAGGITVLALAVYAKQKMCGTSGDNGMGEYEREQLLSDHNQDVEQGRGSPALDEKKDEQPLAVSQLQTPEF